MFVILVDYLDFLSHLENVYNFILVCYFNKLLKFCPLFLKHIVDVALALRIPTPYFIFAKYLTFARCMFNFFSFHGICLCL